MTKSSDPKQQKLSAQSGVFKLLITSVLIVTLSLLAWWGASVSARHQAEKEAAELEVKRTEERLRQQRLAGGFEDILNSLLLDIQSQASEYRLERKVVSELVQPANLSQVDYIETNYELMEQSIAALRGRMDGMVLRFEQADGQVRELVSAEKQDVQANILSQWDDTKSSRMASYVSFFESEEKLLSAHMDLMEFYINNKNSVAYNEETDRMVLSDVGLQDQEIELRLEIKDLALDQARTLLQNVENQKAE